MAHFFPFRPLLVPILFLYASAGFAQSWSWALTGGGSADALFAGVGPDAVNDITTDAHGHVYVLSTLSGADAQVDGHPVPAENGEVVLSSFRCDGSFRWSRAFGTPLGADHGRSIRTDAEGGVYVAAWLAYNLGGVGTDTTWSWLYLSSFVMKFDSTGAFQWLRSPEPVTFAAMPQNYPMDMDVDAEGNSYFLCDIKDPGTYGDGAAVIDQPGVHIFTYDRNGVFLEDIALPMAVDGPHARSVSMRRDPATGRFVLCGYRFIGYGVVIGGQPVMHPMYVASFDAQGGLLWERENTSAFANGFTARPAIDAQGGIYLAGSSSHGDDFLGYAFVNTITTMGHVGPLVVKLNAAGELQWGINGSTDAATSVTSVALSGNDVVVSGQYPGMLSFPGADRPLAHALDQGLDIFTARFSRQTGALQRIDTIPSPSGMDEEVGATATDGHGDLYLGASFAGSVTIGGQQLHTSGGDQDILVAKLGTNSCTVPTGLADAAPRPTFRLFPVPATDHVTLQGARAGQRLVLCDALGRTVREEVLRTDDPVLDIGALTPGTYLVQVATGLGTQAAARILKKP
ncbi:MAG: T9SS type A sorting domain-containing protein [Bacteroidetes bacterium]|nr:T9SS type A sorting domain-containing protein [Bacteroidota bacterium]